MVAEKKPFRRLSKKVKPVHYTVKVQPDLEKCTFSGEETVDVEVKRETSKITVNCMEIDILSVKFTAGDQELEPNNIVYRTDAETVTFVFSSSLPLGPASLHITYDGVLNDKLQGFYRSRYQTSCGETRNSAVTQFEPTCARMAFPCWDEPALKATFDVTIVASKDRVVLSNMDVECEEDDEHDDTLKVVKFKRTPIMSTYLLAFVVGEYDHVEDTTSDGIVVRVYTPVGKKDQGRFPLQVAVKTLPFYSDYFGIAYPLPKLDLIAIPDFEAGAMENWGLVTYRQNFLLIDEEESSANRKQHVALVVGHELAHQWFGNLTTMEWWTHLWLNEGFATWIEFLCVDYCFPDYNIWTQFLVDSMAPALKLDSLSNSHPIEVPVHHPSEINEIFDDISYKKGASVIRMLCSYVGEKDFKEGLHTYLMELKYKNGFTEDLWRHLGNASGKPILKLMSGWTKQMGYPVISVHSEIVGGQTILKISQKKFSADGSSDPLNSSWAVPITLSTSGDPSKVYFKTLLSDRDMVLFLDTTDKWIKLNSGQVGFYRTLYSSEMIESLIPGISSLPPVDRFGVENDIFALAVAGDTTTVEYLKLLAGYVGETDFTVWRDIMSNLNHLAILCQHSEVFDKFKKFVLQLCKPVLDKIGFEPQDNEGHTCSLLRSLLLKQLGNYGDAAIIEEFEKRFKAHCEGTELIPADFRDAVYSTVAKYGDEHTIDQLITLYKNTTHDEEKSRIGDSLGMNGNTECMEKVLKFAISDDVRSQDSPFVMTGFISSLQGRKTVWKFTKENWEFFYTRYNASWLLQRQIAISTKYFATQEDADDIEAFFEAHTEVTCVRTIKQSLESIHLNRQWLDRDLKNISDWLSKAY